MARRRLTQEDLNRYALQHSTKAQAEKLTSYLGGGWRVFKVVGDQGYDVVVMIQNDTGFGVLDPMGVMTRPGHGVKSVSYKIPKTRISYEERAAMSV